MVSILILLSGGLRSPRALQSTRITGRVDSGGESVAGVAGGPVSVLASRDRVLVRLREFEETFLGAEVRILEIGKRFYVAVTE